MTDIPTLHGLLDRWVTVTHPSAPTRVWHGRLAEVWEYPSIVLELPGGGRRTLLADFQVEPAAEPGPAGPADEPRPWADLRSSGLLWLINRTALHPRGLALALHADGTGTFTGWSLMSNDEGEPWQFDPATDYDGYQRAEATLTAALAPPARLLDCGHCYEEDGEEVHPHPECPVVSSAVAAISAATGGLVPTPPLIGETGCDLTIPYTSRPSKDTGGPAACTATYLEPFHGLAHCEQHADRDHFGRPGPWHQGTSQDGSNLYWKDGELGATPHRPDTVRTVQDTRPDTADTARTPATPDTDTSAPTSTDTVRTMSGPRWITVHPPGEATVLAARHLDISEGPVQTGYTVDAATRSAITQVLAYIAKAHNSPTAPSSPDTPTPTSKEPAEDLTLGPDGLTDAERERKTIREVFETELHRPDEHAVNELVAALSRALQAMPRYAGPPRLSATEQDAAPAYDERLGTPENAHARLALAREVLVDDGYFTDDQVGPDIAPRLVEWLSHHRGLADNAGKEVDTLRARVGELAGTLADILSHFTVPGTAASHATVRTDDITAATIARWFNVHQGKGPTGWAFPQVQGHCPACNAKSLFLGSGGYPTCAQSTCTHPEAASDALQAPASHCPRPDCTTTREQAHRATVAYNSLRTDHISAATYLRAQSELSLLAGKRHSRTRLLACLDWWIKDPGPISPVTNGNTTNTPCYDQPR